ncbi:hypothetical protein [Mucilaginibacter gilvus]|uniref:Viral A-type inclusion protein n=1 Tax=Mucilaginibacter gilvus TaxID=2305909 RepID=A0A3S3WD73_9SPHI|nr:hypothetical protein [Mucilaginibacter gilvus]RWY54167.1 hypothetical protein EPL05_08995 [Mucilaginibacter gilvus]
MKKLLAAAIVSMLFFSCADPQKQEKELLDQVIAKHDSVMAKNEQVERANIQLDTLLKTGVLANNDSTATKLIKGQEEAMEKMEDWMHKFDAENKGKSHDAIMAYLTDQKKQIEAIDKDFDAVITATNNYKKSLIKK